MIFSPDEQLTFFQSMDNKYLGYGDFETRQNILNSITTIDTFSVDEVVLPYLFDISNSAAFYYFLTKDTSVFDEAEGRYVLSYQEEWSAMLLLSSLKVFVDGVEYMGPTIDTPEPAALTLFGLGIIGLGVMRRRKTV
jgi:hypothetical protein